MLLQNASMTSLWIASGLGWPERDIDVLVQPCHVGAHFKAIAAEGRI